MTLRKSIYMKISFVLPRFPKIPVGGYKIVFEYANKLCKDGFDVSLVFINNDCLKNKKLPFLVKKFLIYLETKYEPSWFKLDKRIKKISYYDFNFNEKLNSNIAIATAVETVRPTELIYTDAKKCYFIQDFEDWHVSKKYLYSTYELGFKNIVVAKWLKNIIDNYSLQPSIYVRNPIDTSKYKLYKAIKDRDKYSIGMLYHSAPYKGSKETLCNLIRLKDTFPKLNIIMFGTCEPPQNLPKWIKFYKNASQKQTIAIYNSISIFVSGSIKEGFGLTGLEAMACGATLVTTNYDGAKEYAVNNRNALVVPVKNWDALKKSVEYLIKNDSIRMRLAKSGVKDAKKFSLDRSYKKFIYEVLK